MLDHLRTMFGYETDYSTSYLSSPKGVIMSKYRKNLPQFGKKPFITDGGLETTLVFEHGIDLPEFAAFTVLDSEGGKEILWNYYLPFIQLARYNKYGFILEAPTWRASYDWGHKIGYNKAAIKEVNIRSIQLMLELRQRFENQTTPMVISGALGPKGDGYHVDDKMTTSEARDYHQDQIHILSETPTDLVSSYTLNYAEEAVGMTLAAQQADIPIVIGFTLETDGRLPSGQPLKSAIQQVDKETGNGPLAYMINCAHPTHFAEIIDPGKTWTKRIKAIRANSSCKSHEELDASDTLDRGNPVELGHQYGKLLQKLPHLSIFGGCCGTDHRHIKEICTNIKAAMEVQNSLQRKRRSPLNSRQPKMRRAVR